MNLAPIVLFVYNRVEHTQKTIDSLKKNNLAKQSDLFIFSDAPKKEVDIEAVNKVRELIDNVDGFKSVTIFKAEFNRGLADSVIFGITNILNKYEKVIVLEDDLITSKYFLTYMNEGLDLFKDRCDIWSISGYTPNIDIPLNYEEDIYLTKRGCSWGWSTWKDRWHSIDWNITDYDEFKKSKSRKTDFDKYGNDMSLMLEEQIKGRMDSWAIRWCYNQYKQDKYTIYPRYSIVKNIGNDLSGTHSKKTNKYDSKLSDKNIRLNINIKENDDISRSFKNFYDVNKSVYISIIIKKVGLYKQARKIRNALLKYLK